MRTLSSHAVPTPIMFLAKSARCFIRDVYAQPTRAQLQRSVELDMDVGAHSRRLTGCAFRRRSRRLSALSVAVNSHLGPACGGCGRLRIAISSTLTRVSTTSKHATSSRLIQFSRHTAVYISGEEARANMLLAEWAPPCTTTKTQRAGKPCP